MDLSPRGIRTHLQLNRPIYARTAAYGHFGRHADADGGFSWEKTDLVDELKAALRCLSVSNRHRTGPVERPATCRLRLTRSRSKGFCWPRGVYAVAPHIRLDLLARSAVIRPECASVV